jgi:DNA-directed RNA polymerase specialized sigma subunit
MGEKTEREVELAYNAARRIARSFVQKYSGVLPPSVDYEDYVQIGMLAWLESRDMYWEMIRALRKALEFSKYSYKVKKLPVPQMVEFDDERSNRQPIEALEDKIDAQRILDRIYDVEDDRKQFALMGYLFLGMSLRDIGEVFEKSHEWVRTYLIEPELKKIREELTCQKA